jgi:hypothetical protein
MSTEDIQGEPYQRRLEGLKGDLDARHPGIELFPTGLPRP